MGKIEILTRNSVTSNMGAFEETLCAAELLDFKVYKMGT